MQTYARQLAINLAVSEHPHPSPLPPQRERGLDPTRSWMTQYFVSMLGGWNYGERRGGEWESPRFLVGSWKRWFGV